MIAECDCQECGWRGDVEFPSECPRCGRMALVRLVDVAAPMTVAEIERAFRASG